ncbi:MAG TPA: SGNH/GDSL hydrolase family protein [Ignavibacteriaceae bacterium]|nr:SGNH/GDSL hydrolase family protein [Ignavibacteriaceae bacterium]
MKIKLIASIFLSALIFISCDDYNDLTPPVKDKISGSANFARYVALGNSITAGYQNGTLYQSAQVYSYANLIAKQVGTTFEMPLISDPGLGGRMEVKSLDPFAVYTNPASGVPLNLNYPGPYNNLGVPGALLYDVLFAKSSTTCASYVLSSKPTPNPYFDVILRNSVLNLGTPLEQALAQAPTFITLWIGNNDVLGYATSGGTSPSTPTPTSNFQQLYGGVAQGLAQYATQTGAKVVVANIPNVAAIPFFTTVGLQMATNTSIPWSALPLGFVYQKAGETGMGSGSATQQDLKTGKVLVTLLGSTYATLLGQPTGKFYRDNHFPALPAGIDTTKPFGFHPQNPFPNAYVLDDGEITIANNAVSAFNSIIAGLAQNFGFGLVDINTKFNQFRAADFAGGTTINGINFKTLYVSGGLFGLDGVHPTSQAHGIIANEFIKVINSKFGANIPLVDVSSIPGSLVLHKSVQYKDGYPIIPAEAFDHLLF